MHALTMISFIIKKRESSIDILVALFERKLQASALNLQEMWKKDKEFSIQVIEQQYLNYSFSDSSKSLVF